MSNPMGNAPPDNSSLIVAAPAPDPLRAARFARGFAALDLVGVDEEGRHALLALEVGLVSVRFGLRLERPDAHAVPDAALGHTRRLAVGAVAAQAQRFDVFGGLCFGSEARDLKLVLTLAAGLGAGGVGGGLRAIGGELGELIRRL